MKSLRVIAVILGWLASCYALIQVVSGLDFHWNWIYWSPKFDLEAILCAIGILVILVLVGFLARVTRGVVTRIASVIACLLLVVFAFFYVLPPEPISYGFLGRPASSPLWFRLGNVLVLCLPGLLWTWGATRRSRHDQTA